MRRRLGRARARGRWMVHREKDYDRMMYIYRVVVCESQQRALQRVIQRTQLEATFLYAWW